MILREKINNLPNSPGVYIMKDSFDTAIYVGKSKHLKTRVLSYFNQSSSHSSKVKKLVSHVRDLDYRLTDTEFDALLLECSLIRELRPQYNALMKNTSRYCYIRLFLDEEFPYLILEPASLKEKRGLYFGPFTSKKRVLKAIEGIKESFKILCSNKRDTGSECLNYSLGFCSGVCVGNLSEEDYKTIFKKIVDLFNDRDNTVVSSLESKMNKASVDLDFEKAIVYRNYISAINYVIEKERVIRYIKENKSIAVVERLEDNKTKFFLIKGDKVILSKILNTRLEKNSDMIEDLKTNILLASKAYCKTDVSISFDNIDQSQIIYSYLKNKTEGTDYMLFSTSLSNLDNVTKLLVNITV